jgi:hypothetical protein
MCRGGSAEHAERGPPPLPSGRRGRTSGMETPETPPQEQGPGDRGAHFNDIVDRVTARTKGTAGDPLSRAEVEQVVAATLEELGARGVVVLER